MTLNSNFLLIAGRIHKSSFRPVQVRGTEHVGPLPGVQDCQEEQRRGHRARLLRHRVLPRCTRGGGQVKLCFGGRGGRGIEKSRAFDTQKTSCFFALLIDSHRQWSLLKVTSLQHWLIILLDLFATSFPYFYWRGNYRVHGLQWYRTQRSKARAVTLIGILLCLCEGVGRGFMFCTVTEVSFGLPYARFQQKCSTASYCQHELLAQSICTLIHGNHQWLAMAEL